MEDCSSTYYAAVALADADLASDLAACSGDLACQAAAIKVHKQRTDLAYANYLSCSGQSGGGGA